MVKSKVHKLGELLSKSLGSDVEIIDKKTSLLTAPGEHYGSVMLAIDVTIKYETGKEEALNLVAKLPPANDMLRKAFDIPVTFKKEIFAYMETIPSLVQLQKEYDVNDDDLLDKLFPRCYGARISLDANKNEVDDDGVLIFENLKMSGYQTDDRLVGLNFDDAKMIIRDLARFHAVPIALKILKPDVFQAKVMPALKRNKGLEQLPEAVGLAFHNSIIEGAVEQDELAPYLERLKKVVDYAAVNPLVDRPPPNELFASISHSDYWVSNTMLLRDKNGKAIKNKIVDLQIITYNSVVRDLVFFMFTSVINTDLDKHYQEFLQIYHDNFINTLKTFKIDLSPFTWDAFIKELEEVAPTEVYHVLVMLKPICTERGKIEHSLEDFEESDWGRKDLLGPSHRKKLKDTVLAFVKLNWI